MKWIERFKEKVSQTTFPPVSPRARLSEDGVLDTPRDELEQDFRSAWEDFRSSTIEKEKEKALVVAVSLFCKIARQNSDPTRLALSLVDVRSYAFVVARALVTEIKKLRQNAPNGQLQPDGIVGFFYGSQDEGKAKTGPDLLFALECLVSPELDVQPLIDAGLFPSLVYVLYCLISSTISPNEQTISVDNGGSIDPSNTSTVEDEGLEPGEASSATNPKVADAGTEEVSALPGLNPGETVAVNERSPSDSSELQSKNVSLSSEGVILGEPSLAAVDEVETATVVECTCLNEESANKEAEVSIGVLYEVPMEERRALVEAGVVHISKTMARHVGAAQSLLEDDSLQSLFHLISMGIPTREEGVPELEDVKSSSPQHLAQLYRHVMQILEASLMSDNGSTAQYIQTHELIEVLLSSVINFLCHGSGDASYTVGVVSLILNCVQLSSRPESRGVRLKDVFRKGKGYSYLVQLALQLAAPPESTAGDSETPSRNDYSLPTDTSGAGSESSETLPPLLIRLLDIMVDFAQTAFRMPRRSLSGIGGPSGRLNAGKPVRTLFEGISSTATSDSREPDLEGKIGDIEIVQTFQDVFLKTGNLLLQLEILDRLLRLFASHPDNYVLVQELRTMPLFLQNMGKYSLVLQERLLKVLEYAVTVVNCVPEQELLSLCYLLQQPYASPLRKTVLSFFEKLLSFDRKYKKVLREVGLLDLLLDDVRRCGLSEDPVPKNAPDRLVRPTPEELHIFEDMTTVGLAWDCLVSLLKKSDGNQNLFRKANGVVHTLPLLALPLLRTGALRVLSCLICEDVNQVHADELKSLVKIAHNGFVNGRNGSAILLDTESKEDILWTIWRILGANSTIRVVFGDGNGFGLLLSVMEGMQIRDDNADAGLVGDEAVPGPDLSEHMKVLDALLHVVTVGAAENPVNRNKLHGYISSQTFKRLLQRSGLLCPEFEQRVAERLFDVALERVHSLSQSASGLPVLSHGDGARSFRNQGTEGGPHINDGQAAHVDVYNGGAVEVLLFFLLQFTVKSQLRILIQVERLVSESPWNQNVLTSAGCVGALLEAMKSMLQVPSKLLSYALKIVEILGSFRLSSSEMQTLGRIIWLNRDMSGGQMGQRLLQMVERMSQSSPFSSASLSFSSFIEFRMSRMGHACMRTPLGDRTWPPAAGYSFVCWARFEKLSAQSVPNSNGAEASKELHRTRSGALGSVLRIFTVGTAEDKSSVCAELFLSDSGVLTLATSPTSYLCFKGVRLEEGIWYHLTIVHNKPNALAGLFQSSVAYLYLDGSLRHTGKLGYSASPVGKSLQVMVGTPPLSEVSPVTWQLGSCYLFEEVLPAPAIFFMYVLGRGYRGLFQDTDMLRFIPYEACGGGNLMVLESLDTELLATLKAEGVSQNSGEFLSEGSGVTWDLEKLARFWAQLCSRHLIFAYDGSRTEGLVPAGVSSMVNLIDPMSAAASVLGGLPKLARIYGDVRICTPCNIANSMRKVGGVAVVLAMIEAADSCETLHLALSVLVSMLHSNPRNARDLQACRGYHLLALFLHRRMSFFEARDLDFLFRIASCEASFVQKPPQTTIPASEPHGHRHSRSLSSGFDTALNLFGFSSRVPDDQASYYGSTVDYPESLDMDESIAGVSDVEGFDLPREDIDCIVLANPEMMEHVLLDWTLWVTAPIGVQLGLLAFIERLVSMHRYRLHNLTVLRKLNLVQHLLVTLQRGDVEIVVLEKLVVLLGIILEDGFLPSELKYVADFVVMTFDPPHVAKGVSEITRESMGTQVIVRNMLLEMLIELQMTISADDTLDIWHKIVSSKLITFLLDEAVHPTSMRWVMTLLGACLRPSPAFAARFKNSGGFQALARVLPSFYDCPEVYYILFCLIFGKPVYPRQPEVRLLDFNTLLPEDGNKAELFFTELLESVISMAKAAFVRMIVQSESAQKSGDFSGFNISLDADQDGGETLQGEALLHKTYAARLMGGEQAAPGMVASLLRFMVDVAKMCKPFSMACCRFHFLESCVDLYFACIRSAAAVQGAHEAKCETKDELLEDLSNLDDVPAAKCGDASNDKPNVSELRVGTEYPIEVITRSFLKSSSKSEDKFVDTGIDTISEGEALTVELATSPMTSDMSRVSLLTQPLPLDLSETRQAMSTLSAPPTPPRSTKDRTRHLSFSALSTFSGNISEADFNFSDFGPPSSTSITPIETPYAAITPCLLLQLEAAGAGGGPCAAAASAILDFIAEVLAEALLEQAKSTTIVEGVLEAVPMYVNSDAALIFQGLVLRRIINDLERRLLRDAEENFKKLDKNRWAPNLDMLSWLLVDRVYMGAFAEPGGPLNVLEYLLSMLQLANSDGRVEDAIPVAKTMLFTRNGGRQAEAYVISLLKNTNRMLTFCFLPQSISNPTEEDAFSLNGKKINSSGLGSEIILEGLPKGPERGSGDIGVTYQVILDKAAVLQLLLANRKVIFCTINVDLDLVCALCINLFPMALDNEQSNRFLVVEVWKALLAHRSSALEDVLITRNIQGGVLMDVLHGGFDRLLTAETNEFYKWLEENWATVQRVLEQRASTVWRDYVSGASRFPAIRIKSLEARRLREMSRRTRERSKMDTRHWEQMLERRVALELVREAMAAELRVLRQDKYGWILHAESGWADHLQQLVHERAIWPIIPEVCPEEPEWQLCPTEGPYRMRKKLERRKKKLGILGKTQLMEERQREGMDKGTPTNLISSVLENPLHDQYVDLFSSDSQKRLGYPSKEFLASFEEEIGESKIDVGEEEDDMLSARVNWNDDSLAASSKSQEVNAMSVASFKLAGEEVADQVLGSPQGSISPLAQETIPEEPNYLEHEMHEDGEYLIRPHLEPGERIRFRYNCERVAGLDKRDGIFLIGEKCLYVIENYIIDENKCIKEKGEDLSIIDRALGVRSNTAGVADINNPRNVEVADDWPGGRAWAYSGGAWGKEKLKAGQNMPHAWRMWKLESVHELLKRRYQLRPVAIELFSMDGCNDLLVFHKNERDEVFKNLLAMNLPRNSMLDTTISAASKQEASEGGRLFKMMAKSFSKRWQNGEISNFQYLMHLNTLAGRGYNDLTQYPVFPWILKDYTSEELDLLNPETFRRLDKPMGALHPEREKEFRKRYETWEDPEIPRFHYGSHYSSAGSVLFYLIRLPPFSQENKQLQGGDFDHSDRLFNSIKDTWLSASQGNTADVKELIPEFFYLPEFLENRFGFDFGVKQSGERVNDVLLPPWAKGSAREFVRKHREALESQYVSENLHHWIDLIFGFKQRGKPAVEALNVFYHLTYEGAVDIDRVPDPSMKAAVLAQINHFGQTPKLLFTKPHPKRKWVQKQPLALALRNHHLLAPQEMRPVGSMVSQIVIFQDKVYAAGANRILKPPSYSKYLSWGFSDRSLRIISYEQEKLLSTHENLHDDGPVLCAGFSRDGRTLVTGGEDGVVSVWRQRKDGLRGQRRLHLKRALCAHTDAVICLAVSQPYSLIASGSKDRTVIFWDLSSLEYVRQLPELPEPPTAIHANDMTGEVVTASGTTLSVWSINGDCLAAVNTSHLATDTILSITSPHLSDWMEASWYVSGHQNGVIRLWHMELDNQSKLDRRASHRISGSWGWQNSQNMNAGFLDMYKSCITGGPPEYQLVLYKVLSWHKEPVTALSLGNDLKQLCSGDAGGHLVSWTLPDDGFKQTPSLEIEPDQCTTCQKELNEVTEKKHHCRNCGQISCADCCNNLIVLEDLGYFSPVRVCGGCYESRQSLTGRQLTFSRTSSEVCRSTPPTEHARNGSELASELLNALKSASATTAESKQSLE
ncbi:hypothetical protein KC19_VG063500 [Ceratodon purpureus]|uniref:Uncharacterized protein n=1 Tax=Ceratodon purpureus TaxID=3225 RepID=A0A8T0HMH8_CERPU|nr:hypothetical protein KC19_VG063500 [Ceratodon purpureus]